MIDETLYNSIEEIFSNVRSLNKEYILKGDYISFKIKFSNIDTVEINDIIIIHNNKDSNINKYYIAYGVKDIISFMSPSGNYTGLIINSEINRQMELYKSYIFQLLPYIHFESDYLDNKFLSYYKVPTSTSDNIILRYKEYKPAIHFTKLCKYWRRSILQRNENLSKSLQLLMKSVNIENLKYYEYQGYIIESSDDKIHGFFLYLVDNIHHLINITLYNYTSPKDYFFNVLYTIFVNNNNNNDNQYKDYTIYMSSCWHQDSEMLQDLKDFGFACKSESELVELILDRKKVSPEKWNINPIQYINYEYQEYYTVCLKIYRENDKKERYVIPVHFYIKKQSFDKNINTKLLIKDISLVLKPLLANYYKSGFEKVDRQTLFSYVCDVLSDSLNIKDRKAIYRVDNDSKEESKWNPKSWKSAIHSIDVQPIQETLTSKLIYKVPEFSTKEIVIDNNKRKSTNDDDNKQKKKKEDNIIKKQKIDKLDIKKTEIKKKKTKVEIISSSEEEEDDSDSNDEMDESPYDSDSSNDTSDESSSSDYEKTNSEEEDEEEIENIESSSSSSEDDEPKRKRKSKKKNDDDLEEEEEEKEKDKKQKGDFTLKEHQKRAIVKLETFNGTIINDKTGSGF